jgi:hypothetical protein
LKTPFFYDNDALKDMDKIFYIFHEKLIEVIASQKAIFVIDYSPIVAYCMASLRVHVGDNGNGSLYALAFFHDDEALSLTNIDETDNLLNYNVMLIERMLKHPFIKKYYVPLDYRLTVKYIKSLIWDLYNG